MKLFFEIETEIIDGELFITIEGQSFPIADEDGAARFELLILREHEKFKDTRKT